jgi:putative ABC transport system substrate-binding protein
VSCRTLLACTLLTALPSAPLRVDAQEARKVHRIGILDFFPLPNPRDEAFRQTLRGLGYLEGRNVVIVSRSADGIRERLPQLAADLVAAKVDVIVVTSGTSALAVQEVTSKIPVVMTASADAVRMGIVDSFARPGRNVTGLTVISTDLAPKRLELLTALPGVRKIAVLWCPVAPINHDELRHTSETAKRLGVQVEPVEYRQGSTTWPSLTAALLRARPQGLFLLDCTYLPFQQLMDFAIQHQLPTTTPYPALAQQGALLAYGADVVPMARRAASYVDRIIKGSKPADLPVEQPTQFELVVNLKTARAIGMRLPQSILVRASRVID